MPLPTGDQQWPPASLDGITDTLAAWSAWYEGTPEALRAAYGKDVARPRTRAAQYAGGVTGAVARWWWGRPTGDQASSRGQLHVPIAADIAQASADLLFSEPPTLTASPGQGGTGSESTRVQDRLDTLADDGLYATLAEAAEVGSALGGSYLRVTWDPAVAPAPFLTSVHADGVVPEFRWGRLVAGTIWRRVYADERVVLRHLERHELDSNGTGVVLHGLYQGTPDRLGQVIPLTEHPATAGLATVVDANGAITTASPGLALVYVPNQRPQRRWRTHPLGVNLGRSDLDGVEPLMDALDETYSSWMRDLRLAKARLVVPDSMLTSHGLGGGTSFDLDREVFSPVHALVDPTSVGQSITPVQFEIRVEQHARTASELTEQILRTAGYSAQTFGEGPDGAAITATEVHSRERRSFLTRDRKIRHWRPGTTDAVTKLLAVDAALFAGPWRGEVVGVAFGDTVQDSPLASAQTAQALRTAQAASTKTLVQLTHPDWDEAAVLEEVAAIQAEQGLSVTDPGTFGRGGDGLALPTGLDGALLDTGR